MPTTQIHRKPLTAGIILGIAVVCLFILDILLGSIHIPVSDIFNALCGKTTSNEAFNQIIIQFRLPKAITALLAGTGLAICGLQMQTLFRNPLAGPFILGISSGASLGVAIVMLGASFAGAAVQSMQNNGNWGIVFAAWAGASTAMALVLLVSRKINNNTTLLVLGLMFGYLTSALEGILQYFSEAISLQGFVIWSMGSFSNVVWDSLYVLIPSVVIGLVLSFMLSKPLNALLLGESYASSMGVKIQRNRIAIILTTGLLAGSITAYCGPIAFLGTAIPHLCRNWLNTADHKILTPAVCLMGAALALFCDIIAQMPGTGHTLPINAVTSLIGAPIVIWVVIKQNRKSQHS